MTTIRHASLAVLAILVPEYGIGMAVMTGIALLCYAANLYLLPRPASQPATAPYPPGAAAGGAATGAGKSRV